MPLTHILDTITSRLAMSRAARSNAMWVPRGFANLENLQAAVPPLACIFPVINRRRARKLHDLGAAKHPIFVFDGAPPGQPSHRLDRVQACDAMPPCVDARLAC